MNPRLLTMKMRVSSHPRARRAKPPCHRDRHAGDACRAMLSHSLHKPPRPRCLRPVVHAQAPDVLHDIRVVLVAPKGVQNIGAVCRACANFEAIDLVLVAPRCDTSDPQILTARIERPPVEHHAACASRSPQPAPRGVCRRPRAARVEAAQPPAVGQGPSLPPSPPPPPCSSSSSRAHPCLPRAAARTCSRAGGVRRRHLQRHARGGHAGGRAAGHFQ